MPRQFPRLRRAENARLFCRTPYRCRRRQIGRRAPTEWSRGPSSKESEARCSVRSAATGGGPTSSRSSGDSNELNEHIQVARNCDDSRDTDPVVRCQPSTDARLHLLTCAERGLPGNAEHSSQSAEPRPRAGVSVSGPATRGHAGRRCCPGRSWDEGSAGAGAGRATGVGSLYTRRRSSGCIHR